MRIVADASRLPLSEQAMQRFAVFFRVQPLARFAVGQQLGDFREDFEMLLGSLFGDQQEDQQRHRLTVGRFEGDGIGQAHERGERLLQAFDPAMRNRDALAKTRRPEALARKQIVSDRAAGDAVLVFENQARLLEDAFLWLNDSCWQAETWPGYSSLWRLSGVPFSTDAHGDVLGGPKTQDSRRITPIDPNDNRPIIEQGDHGWCGAPSADCRAFCGIALERCGDLPLTGQRGDCIQRKTARYRAV
jgi:hypothetical protein